MFCRSIFLFNSAEYNDTKIKCLMHALLRRRKSFFHLVTIPLDKPIALTHSKVHYGKSLKLIITNFLRYHCFLDENKVGFIYKKEYP